MPKSHEHIRYIYEQAADGQNISLCSLNRPQRTAAIEQTLQFILPLLLAEAFLAITVRESRSVERGHRLQHFVSLFVENIGVLFVNKRFPACY